MTTTKEKTGRIWTQAEIEADFAAWDWTAFHNLTEEEIAENSKEIDEELAEIERTTGKPYKILPRFG